MAIQQTSGYNDVSNYEDFSDKLFKSFVLFYVSKYKAREVHIVPDKYWDISLKSSTRNKRLETTKEIQMVKKTQNLGPIKELLKNISFKKQIWSFCLSIWSSKKEYCDIGVDVYVGAHKLRYMNPEHISELEVPGVEEADSIMLRHAAYSEKDGVGVIMFEYTDRDVLVNTLWATNYLKSNLYWRDRISEKIFDLSKAAQRLGRDLVEALPGFHCFTGNDHNAALIYQGKATPFQKLKKCKEAIQSFSEMGSYENVQETTIPGIRKFVLSLYATQKFQINNCKTTDVARTKMVCSVEWSEKKNFSIFKS